MKLAVNVRHPTGHFDHFWRSTGFMPAALLLDPDMRQMMEYLGSIPHGGMQYVRIHYLLDLVRGAKFADRNPDVDWSLLDECLDVLVGNGLKPFFELMGNPCQYWTDFEDPAQVRAWRRFVASLATHCEGRYGRTEVRSWYFETWNEPDVGWWKGTVKGFMNYYDACSAGLEDADKKLVFGGPGTASTLSKMFCALMEHVDTGKNFFTGKRGTRIDFISVHEKGAVWSKENISPDLRKMCERELKVVTYLRRRHPRLARLPFMNNECDPQIGWSDPHTWHATAYYAANSAKGIGQHLRFLREENGVDYVLHGNDNGFPGGWGVRTHLATLGDRKDIRTGPFDQIKKPFHNLMIMMSLLGDRGLQVAGEGGSLDDFGYLATRRGNDQVAVLLYHNNDRVHAARNQSVRTELTISGLPFESGAVTHYRIVDGDLPFDVWDAAHADHVMRTPILTPELLKKLRDRQELERASHNPGVSFAGGRYACSIEVAEPSVHLVLFTRRPARGPGRVSGLRTRRYYGLSRQPQAMVIWEGLDSRTLRTYEVFHAARRSGPYRRVNTPDILCTAFLHVADEVRGWYKVRAVDYWGRAGELSAPVGT